MFGLVTSRAQQTPRPGPSVRIRIPAAPRQPRCSARPRNPPVPQFTCGLLAVDVLTFLCHLWLCDSISVFFVPLLGPLSRLGRLLLFRGLLLGQVGGHGGKPQGQVAVLPGSLQEGNPTPQSLNPGTGPGPRSIPRRNFPSEPPRRGSAPARRLPTLSESLKPMPILAALLSFTSLPSGFAHQSPRPASLWERSSSRGRRPGAGSRSSAEAGGPVPGFPATWRSALQRPPLPARLPAAARLGLPLRRPPPPHTT